MIGRVAPAHCSAVLPGKHGLIIVSNMQNILNNHMAQRLWQQLSDLSDEKRAPGWLGYIDNLCYPLIWGLHSLKLTKPWKIHHFDGIFREKWGLSWAILVSGRL